MKDLIYSNLDLFNPEKEEEDILTPQENEQ